jgi:nucleoside-diphosphate-sugar epimerase
MYGRVAGPMSEDLRSNANTRKGEVRAQLADRLLDAHHRGALRATIGRGSDFFGPNVLMSHAGERLFGPVLARKRIDVLGDPDKRHTFTFIDDFGAALVVLGEREEALGKAWHVPNAETLTHRAFVERVCKLAGAEPQMRVVPRWLVSIMASSARFFEVKEMQYQFGKTSSWTAPFTRPHGNTTDDAKRR